jgi:predicted PurR-regulated permease PerM
MAEKAPISITITPTSVVYAVVIVLLVWLLFYLKSLVLVVLTAIVIASSIEPGVLWFIKRGLARVWSVSIFYIVIFGFLFGVAYLMVPPVLSEAGSFLAILPNYLVSFNLSDLVSQDLITTTQRVVAGGPSLANTLFDLQKAFTPTGEGAFRAVSGIFGGVFSFFLIILLSVYFAVNETGIDDFLRLVMPVRHQAYAVSLWRRSQHKIGLWMQGQLILSLLIAVLAYLCLAIFQVPYALLLALFAAIAELVPVFGSIVAAVPAIIIAFGTGGISLAATIAVAYVVINQLQGHLIYPLVVKKVIGIPPLLVIIALIAGAQLAGFLGVLLAVPAAAVFREFLADFEKAKYRAAEAEKNG